MTISMIYIKQDVMAGLAGGAEEVDEISSSFCNQSADISEVGIHYKCSYIHVYVLYIIVSSSKWSMTAIVQLI